MSIPSNPFGMPPNIPPTDPISQPTNPAQFPSGQSDRSSLDPTGVWASFLSTPGNPASAKDVKMFIVSMLKMFNVLIQQENAAAKKASQKLKRALEGKE